MMMQPLLSHHKLHSLPGLERHGKQDELSCAAAGLSPPSTSGMIFSTARGNSSITDAGCSFRAVELEQLHYLH